MNLPPASPSLPPRARSCYATRNQSKGIGYSQLTMKPSPCLPIVASSGTIMPRHRDQSKGLSCSAKNFFAEIYDTSKTKIDIKKQNQIIEKIDKQLSLESKNALNKPLKLAELKKALKDSKNGKTPGIDVSQPNFTKNFQKNFCPCSYK